MKMVKNSDGPSWQVKARAFAMPLTWLFGCWAVFGFLTLQHSANVASSTLFLIALLCSIPAVLHLALYRVLHEEWVQSTVLIGWLAFAALAMAAPGNLYTPLISLAVLPIMAAVSFGMMRRILEASIVTALLIGAVAIAGEQGLLPQNGGALAQLRVLELVGLVLSLLIVGVGLAAVLPLMDARARLRDALFRKSPHNDFCILRDGSIVCASDQALRWRKAKNLKELLCNAKGFSVANAELRKAFDTGKSASVVVLLGADAKQHVLHVHRLDMRRVILSLRDVSKEYEREAILRAEREAAITASKDKSLFLASMSHELRTPLNAIIGFSDMMKARLFGPIPAKYAEYADLIHESGRHLVDLVGDVLDMSKIESAHYKLSMENFELTDVVRSCVKLLQLGGEEAGVKVTTDLPDFDVPVIADRKAIRQILFNLLSNAIKFTPGGGTVVTRIELKDDHVILCVSDDGVGMSQDDATRVGQPFQQAESAKQSDARGTGLGLSLVKALSELHEGTFHLQSELGQGTKIELHLPILDPVKFDHDTVQALDVRAHIRRAQEASEQITAIAARIAN